jgi:hypothetical protein
MYELSNDVVELNVLEAPPYLSCLVYPAVFYLGLQKFLLKVISFDDDCQSVEM